MNISIAKKLVALLFLLLTVFGVLLFLVCETIERMNEGKYTLQGIIAIELSENMEKLRIDKEKENELKVKKENELKFNKNKNVSVKIVNDGTCPYKIVATEEMREKIQYACDISNNDKRFIYLIEAETSSWDINKKSIKGYYRHGILYHDWGICQISGYYHKEIVNDERFKNWKWQLDQCKRLYYGGTKFYAVVNIPKVIGRFK